MRNQDDICFKAGKGQHSGILAGFLSRKCLRPLLCLAFIAGLAGCAQADQHGRISAAEVRRMIDAGEPFTLIDVREPDEFADRRVPGAINIPLSKLEQRYTEIPREGTVVLMCRSDRRSGIAQDFLRKKGYTNTLNMEGGILDWR
jgi:rhodanese-related sulfurtransferase